MAETPPPNVWQVGDVIREAGHAPWMYAGGVVTTKPAAHGWEGADQRLWAWFYDREEGWRGPYHGDPEAYVLHPDPGPILASFTAWCLSGGGPNG